MLGGLECKRLKAAALPPPKRPRADRSKSLGSVSLSFDRPLPGKPPTRPPPAFSEKPLFSYYDIVSGERGE